MFFLSRRSLADSIVETLSESVSFSAASLQIAIAKRYRKVTPQALYKELRRLQREGVVVKAGRSYSLSLRWVLETVEFAKQLEQTFHDKGRRAFQLPDSGKRVHWNFSDLQRLDDFWDQAILGLVDSTGSKQLYQWIPHAWFHLVRHKQEVRFETALRTLRCRNSLVIGGETALDDALTRFMSPEVYDWCTGIWPGDLRQNSYLTVVGTFVLEIRMDKDTVATIEKFFQATQSTKDLAPKEVRQLMTQKAVISVTLKNDATRAKKLSKLLSSALQEQFGRLLYS